MTASKDSLNLELFNIESKSEFPTNKKLKERLRKVKPKKLDEDFENLHDKVFESLDCLECANCCKTTSPIFFSIKSSI